MVWYPGNYPVHPPLEMATAAENSRELNKDAEIGDGSVCYVAIKRRISFNGKMFFQNIPICLLKV